MTEDQEKAWLQERRTGIGGSDAAAVLGLSRWRSPLDVYHEKCGDALQREETPSMRWGKVLEPVVLQAYSDYTGREVLAPSVPLIRHEERPWMLASLDGYTRDQRIVEAKTSRAGDGWGEPGTDEIPTEYLLQVQHYMIVTAFSVADVAVLIGGHDFRVYEVPADPELQQLMLAHEAEFWLTVQSEVPPPPLVESDLHAYIKAKPGRIVATSEVRQAVENLRIVKQTIKSLEEQEAAERFTILSFMAEHDTLVDQDGNTLATWKEAKPATRLDTKRLKEEQPDLYELYARQGEPSRRFLLK